MPSGVWTNEAVPLAGLGHRHAELCVSTDFEGDTPRRRAEWIVAFESPRIWSSNVRRESRPERPLRREEEQLKAIGFIQ